MPCGGCWSRSVDSGRHPPGPTPVQHEGRPARRHCGYERSAPTYGTSDWLEPDWSDADWPDPPWLERPDALWPDPDRSDPTWPDPDEPDPDCPAGATGGEHGQAQAQEHLVVGRAGVVRRHADLAVGEVGQIILGRLCARRETVEQALADSRRRTAGARGSDPSPRTSRCRRCRRSRPRAPSRDRSRWRAASASSSGVRPLHCSMYTLCVRLEALRFHRERRRLSFGFDGHDDDVIGRIGDGARHHRPRGQHHGTSRLPRRPPLPRQTRAQPSLSAPESSMSDVSSRLNADA